MSTTDTVENIQKEWRDIVLSKLARLETEMGQLSHAFTDMRIAQVTQKEVERLEKLCSDQDERIKTLESAKTQVYTIFFTLQVVIGAVWALILAFKK